METRIGVLIGLEPRDEAKTASRAGSTPAVSAISTPRLSRGPATGGSCSDVSTIKGVTPLEGKADKRAAWASKTQGVLAGI